MKNLNEKIIHIPVDSVDVEGILAIPEKAKGIVIFAHGSGSSRHSPRNRYVASILQKNGFATLLFDLLTKQEDFIYENRFNILLIAERLKIVTKWLMKEPKTKGLPKGYFGASTGSAAALVAASELGTPIIKAVVSRGGRPDLAGSTLENVQSPTLLIVGGDDFDVIELNKEASQLIPAKKELHIIPGATHLFEEPGTLEKAANLATEWFKQHFLIDTKTTKKPRKTK